MRSSGDTAHLGFKFCSVCFGLEGWGWLNRPTQTKGELIVIRALYRNDHHYLIVIGATVYGAHSVIRIYGRRNYQRVLTPVVCKSTDEATREAERLVRAKRRCGYVEVEEEIKTNAVATAPAFCLPVEV